MEGTYRKSKGNAGLDGIQFQVNLVTIFLLNALQKLKGWKISTENQDAAKFDDIVMEFSDGHAVLVQAKSKISRKITKEQLLSTNPKNIDFSLPKYFFSYHEIKSKFKPKALFICTNADVSRKGLENISVRYSVPPDNPLHYDGGRCSTLTFKDNILPDLKNQAEIYHQQNLQGKALDKSVITDENLKEFLKTFTIVFNYPNGKKMDKVIDLLLKRLTRHIVTSQELYKKLEDWFKQERGEYLTEARAQVMFWEIKSDQYCRVLKYYNVFFKCSNFDFKDPSQLFHVRAEDGDLLPTLKVYSTLQNLENKTIYIKPDCDLEEQKLAVEAFKFPKYEFIVLVLSKSLKVTDIKDILRQTLRDHPYKKVILVCKKQFVPNFDLGYDICDIDGSVSFQDLTEETTERLIRKKSIIFQGQDVTLKELLQASVSEDFGKALRSETLEKLVKGDRVSVGTELLDLNDDTSRYYIHRTFERDIGKEIDYDRSIADRKQFFTEKSILQVEDKVILISDTAGMGKSTVLAKLAAYMKEMNSHIWVIRIELNDHTKVLRDFLRKKKESIQIADLLNSHYETKLRNPLEKFVFTQKGRIVVMLDGFDEISPDYTNLILSLVSQCHKASNVAKAIITTRPHMSQSLETLLQVKPFVLQPFTRQNQVEFLTSYWMHNLELDEASRENCTLYSDTLIDKMSSWVHKENNLTAIPLQLRILAEIFQENINSADWEGCKEFLNGDEAIPTLPEKMNIAKLYDMFVEKKLDIFIDKANPTGTATSNNFFNSHFHQYFVNHQSLAIDMILGNTTISELFSIYKYNDRIETDMLKIGIVQKFSKNLDFVHRTFAEYFVAKSIIEISMLEQQTMNSDVKFQQFFIDEILCNPEFVVVRAFLESCLEDVVHYLPSDTFNNYKCHPCHDQKSRKDRSELVHLLAGEGCVAILQLMLKCINFKMITHEAGILKQLPDKEIVDKNENTLEILQRLVDAEGINVKDEKGNTPLHFAAEWNHTKMVSFLFEIGAHVDIKNKDGITALLAAAYNGHLDTVKFLVEQGADVNVRNKNVTTPLHSAAQNGHVDTVEFLLLSKAEIVGNHSGTYALHLAAQDGHLDTVKVLLGLSDVNVRNGEGITPLHLASANGHYDTVEFLATKGADIHLTDNDGFTALHVASQNGHIDVVTLLIDIGADINKQSKNGTSPLHSAAINGHLNIIKTFVQHGVDINIGNCSGSTALHSAVLNNHLEIVEFLVDNGAYAAAGNCNGFTALHLAAQKDHLDIVRFLMRQRGNEDCKSKGGSTPLHIAAQKGHRDVVEALAEVCMDINVQNKTGFSPIHLAVEEGYLNIVQVLVQHKADINVKSRGITPLHLTAVAGNVEIVKFLLENDADTNVTDDDDFTPLHLAVERGHLDIVQLLLDYGTDIDFKNNFGNTSLHLAIVNNHLDIAECLLEHNIDVNAINNYGLTALHIATRTDCLEEMELLLQHCSVDVKGVNEATSLHLAVQNGNLNVVKVLVEAGADVNMADCYGNTLMHEAVQCKDFDLIAYLVEQGTEVNRRNNFGLTPLHVAVAGGCNSFVNFFIKHGLDLNVRDSEGNFASKPDLNNVTYSTGGLELDVDYDQSPLHEATRQGDLDVVQFLVGGGLNVNSKDDKNCTPLLTAAKWNRTFVIKFLVILGASIGMKDGHGCTPLHYIARWGDLDCIKFLTERGADINPKDAFGQTPLHFAAKWGNVECIKFFIDNGTKIDIRDAEGRTPLHLAARWGELNCIRYFAELGVDLNVTDDRGRTPLHSLARWGDLQSLEYFVGKGADVYTRDNQGQTPLHSAARWGDIQVVKFLIENGVEANVQDKKGNTPLHIAAKWGDLESLKLFIEQEVDVNIANNDGVTLLHAAASWADMDCVKFLVERGADVKTIDNKGRTPLHSTAMLGDLNCAKFFVERTGTGVKDKDGLLPLHFAALKSNLACIKYFIECGVDTEAKDGRGRTPLHFAIISGDPKCVKLFVEYRVDLNVGDEKGYTPLHYAACLNRLDCVKYLNELGVDVNRKDNIGRTPLHIAAKWGNEDCVKLIVDCGGDMDIKDDGGCTPMQMATQNGRSLAAKPIKRRRLY